MRLFLVTILEVDLVTASATPLIEHWAAESAEEILVLLLEKIRNTNTTRQDSESSTRWM